MIYLRGITACGCDPKDWQPADDRICRRCSLPYSKMDAHRKQRELDMAELAAAEKKRGTSHYTFRADGDANFYTILKDENWFARIQFNGELTTERQEALVKLMANVLTDQETEAMLRERGFHLPGD